MSSGAIRRRRVLAAVTIGAITGFFTLGLGGRLAMFGFAQLTERPNVWTLGGTVNVGFAGSVAGVFAAMLFVLTERWLLPRAGVLMRGAVFGVLTLLVLSPGIRPPWPLTFALFVPAFLAYGTGFVAIWSYWRRRAGNWTNPDSNPARCNGDAIAVTSALNHSDKLEVR
ncbi:MAG TPA: hypothetical protein VHM24_04175 [Gemmatimonadaceae bacterium]|nr:hypothetical protein [Gemmatimonadaceae bacterium]